MRHRRTTRDLWTAKSRRHKSRCAIMLSVSLTLFLMLFTSSAHVPISHAAQRDKSAKDFTRLDEIYQNKIWPLVKQACNDCHNDQAFEGELSLERFEDIKSVRSKTDVWQKVLLQVESEEMPPKDAMEFSTADRTELTAWIKDYLHAEALDNAGDPGPVVLRRLSNAEYTYTLRDLTGLQQLNPAIEFPVDGAAGEGFTNVGSGLVMSPSLFDKYLKAAKGVAEHLVLLPDGIGFSQQLSERDRTDEILHEIRQFYLTYTVPGGDTARNLQGVRFLSQDAGVVKLAPYISATIRFRTQLLEGSTTIGDVAREEQLNQKYLELIWNSLIDESPSILLKPIRTHWRGATLDDVEAVVSEIERLQQTLWRFTSVGHIGKRDGPTAWQEPISPIAYEQEFAVSLNIDPSAPEGKLFLATFASGDGETGDVARWIRPRLSISGLPEISLTLAEKIASTAEDIRDRELARTSEYLDALASSEQSGESLDKVAEDRELELTILARWGKLRKLASPIPPQAAGHFTNRLENVGGYADVRGWGETSTPSLIANRSADTYRFSTLTVPGRSVHVHPSPDRQAVVYWQSPFAGSIQFEGMVGDSDGNCGNGVHWRLTHLSQTHAGGRLLQEGSLDNAARISFASETEIEVQKGDLIKLAIDPKNREHVCDTTQINLHIETSRNENLIWDLSEEVSQRVEEANPLSDRYGNIDVWHFCATELNEAMAPFAYLNSSLLGEWATAVDEERFDKAKLLAENIAHLVTSSTTETSDQNVALRNEVRGFRNTMPWIETAIGQHQHENTLDDILTEPGTETFSIPQMFAESTFRANVQLDPERGQAGSVQVTVSTVKPETTSGLANSRLNRGGSTGKWTDPEPNTVWASPILVTSGSETEVRIVREIEQFRSLFPAAMCYVQIVPVDEVVTLTLFYREDNHLKRLMLDEAQAKKLDQLWDKLHFVSKDALKLVDAFEQLWQYATQDADPSAFEPMRQPIMQRAESFQKTMKNAEAKHVESLAKFAVKAWRYYRQDQTDEKVREFYAKLRDQELDHADALQLTLARILVAPEFLYKMEEPSSKTESTPVSNAELASRLSFFLWSSTPDTVLHDAITNRTFANEADRMNAVREQARRMILDARTVRLAEQFGCQWIGVRDFEDFDEKSETSFPEFKQLRPSIGNEARQFFTDFFQNDRSVLSLIDADHTFVDPSLAEFYSVQDKIMRSADQEEASRWTRVDGMKELGRGGILGMAATLAKQSGASRTSPILRGNWVYEVLLGSHLPKPPKNVPILPETVPDGLSERELIEMHSSAPECAKCHEKIDGYGFALEGFDAIGRARSGANTRVKLPDGTEIDGLAGLRSYLLQQRRDEFVYQFCRKLLGYALGRSVQLSDQPLLDEMVTDLEKNDYKVSSVIEKIVTSPQFTRIRGSDSGQAESEPVASR